MDVAYQFHRSSPTSRLTIWDQAIIRDEFFNICRGYDACDGGDGGDDGDGDDHGDGRPLGAQ